MEAISTEKRRVYDPLLRLTHWWVALAILVLLATSQLAEFFEHTASADAVWSVHIGAGYALAAGLLTRVLWGLVGPWSARWRDLWHPVAWRGMLRLRWPEPRFGHDAAASLGYLAAYSLMVLMVLTGLGLAAVEFDAGPLAGWLGGAEWLEDIFEGPHEFGYVALLIFIGLHLSALVWHRLRGERVAQSMVTGNQYGAVDRGGNRV